MGDNSKIQWTDATWNFIAGCSPVSEGCRNCYAARGAVRMAGNPNAKIRAKYEGTAEMRGLGDKRRAVFIGRINVNEDAVLLPLRWRRPRRVFVTSMSDLFHVGVSDNLIARAFAVMQLASQHTFQVLTKRPERAAALLNSHEFAGLFDDWRERISPRCGDFVYPIPNVWIGTSVEDQESADIRIPQLLRTRAALRFLSCEPLIGPVDLESARIGVHLGAYSSSGHRTGVDWVIVGGESGPGARPFDVSWAQELARQCGRAHVACFVKQLGARPYTECYDRLIPLELKDSHGGDWEEWPDNLRIREFPDATV